MIFKLMKLIIPFILVSCGDFMSSDEKRIKRDNLGNVYGIIAKYDAGSPVSCTELKSGMVHAVSLASQKNPTFLEKDLPVRYQAALKAKGC